VPSGTVSGDTMAEQSYIHLKDDVGMVDIYAPYDADLERIALHYEREDGIPEYKLVFKINNNIYYSYDHIVTVIDRIDAVAPEAADDSREVSPRTPVSVKAGEHIGSTEGTLQGRSFDFKVYDLTHENPVANPERFTLKISDGYSLKYYRAICPYSLYTEQMYKEYSKLFGSPSGTLFPDTECRNPCRDVPGTAAGYWFLDAEGDEDYSRQFTIASSLDGGVRWGGTGKKDFKGDFGTCFDSRFEDNPLDPESIEVGDSYCYTNDMTEDDFTYIKLISDDELAVYYGLGRCPGAFPDSGYRVYHR